MDSKEQSSKSQTTKMKNWNSGKQTPQSLKRQAIKV